MAASLSPTTKRRYGVARVCRAWRVPRSSYYAAQTAAAATPEPGPALRRGPKPAIADAALLAAIRADLVRSPWTGEGHRKVWARLRTQDGIRVARKRVLRLMREHHLLSPHRARTRPEAQHDCGFRSKSAPDSGLSRTLCGVWRRGGGRPIYQVCCN